MAVWTDYQIIGIDKPLVFDGVYTPLGLHWNDNLMVGQAVATDKPLVFDGVYTPLGLHWNDNLVAGQVVLMGLPCPEGGSISGQQYWG